VRAQAGRRAAARRLLAPGRQPPGHAALPLPLIVPLLLAWLLVSPANAGAHPEAGVAVLPVPHARPAVAGDVAGGGPATPVDSLAAGPGPAFPAPTVRAWQVGLLRPDRLQHAGFSFTLAVAGTIGFRDRTAGGAVALALGAAKEGWDSRHGGADAVDLLADAVGVALGVVAVRSHATGP